MMALASVKHVYHETLENGEGGFLKGCSISSTHKALHLFQ